MKKTKKLWLGMSLTSALMFGTSLGGSYYVMERFEPELSQEKHIVINGDTLTQEEFAENIKAKDSIWYYHNPKTGKKIDLNDLSDYRVKGDRRYRLYQNLKVHRHIDTIRVKKDHKEEKLYYFYGPNDSIPNIPSMGSMAWNRLNLRYFYSDDVKVQQQLEKYNDELNCTSVHEMQHFLNAQAGINKSGRSYETVFADNCMDEVSANLAQFMAQRKNYIEHGNNPRYITERFRFYNDWLKTHNPKIDHVSAEEASFIANGVFNAWKEDKYDIYIKNNVGRAISLLSEADYNGCQDKNPAEHHRLMHRICHINGIDFYKYIKGREQEFIQDMPQSTKEQFAVRLKMKKKAMGYFEKVGQLTDNNPQQKYKHFQNLKFKHNWNKFKEKLLGR